MSGGAVQENWAVDAERDRRASAGAQQWVLRMDAPARVAESLTSRRRVPHPAGDARAQVLAPRPLWLCEDLAVTGRAVLHHGSACPASRRAPGRARSRVSSRTGRGSPASSQRTSRACTASSRRSRGSNSCRRSLARDNIAHYRAYLDTLADAHPALEWGLRWCELNAPARRGDDFHPPRLPHRQLPRRTKAGSPACSTGNSRRSAIRSRTSAGYSPSAGALRQGRSPVGRRRRSRRIPARHTRQLPAARVDAGGARILAGDGAPALGGHRAAAARAPSLRASSARSSWR